MEESSMAWTDWFDEIFVINLPKRKDRLEQAITELQPYDIPVTIVPAIESEDGKSGLIETVKKLFKESLNKKRILTFEDDIRLLQDPTQIMSKCIPQLEKLEWDMFHLGLNLNEKPKEVINNCLIKVTNGYALHAAAYSQKGIEKVLQVIEKSKSSKPLDVLIANEIQKDGNCYCSFPMVATQRADFSNIENRYVDYSQFLEKRFVRNTGHLNYQHTWVEK